MAKRKVDPILKHIITYICPQACKYCINQYMHPKIAESYNNVEDAYKDLQYYDNYGNGHVHGYNHIAITGGEPTEDKSFKEIAALARQYFEKVSLWTQNKKAVGWEWLSEYFDDIVLGIHDSGSCIDTDSYSEVSAEIPVYASILADNYSPHLPKYFFDLGYSGMTIRQGYPNGAPLKTLVQTSVNFPIRYIKKENCYGGYALLPNNNYVECTG